MSCKLQAWQGGLQACFETTFHVCRPWSSVLTRSDVPAGGCHLEAGPRSRLLAAARASDPPGAPCYWSLAMDMVQRLAQVLSLFSDRRASLPRPLGRQSLACAARSSWIMLDNLELVICRGCSPQQPSGPCSAEILPVMGWLLTLQPADASVSNSCPWPAPILIAH